MIKKTSLKDIAHEAGVSIALVSYVLNGKNTKRINVETAEKIKQIAKALNYQPNQIAKSLKSNKTYTLGLIVADISNFFYSYIAGHIEDEANRFGYNVLFGSAYEDPKRFQKLLDVMLARQVDALILAIPDGAEDSLNTIKDSGVPFVLIDREFPEFGELNSIVLDNYNASASVVRKFASLGCRKVAAIGLESNLFHLQERSRGFTEIAEQILGPSTGKVYNLSEGSLPDKIQPLIKQILEEEQVDGICCFTNKIAMATLPLLLSLKVQVPKEITIICYDEVEAYKLFPYPMSFVRQPLEEMSKEAVRYLLGQDKHKVMGVRKFEAVLIDMQGYS
ncbi:LacI family DNA-binding transcriptional regulator [Sphingobacterium faecale]|uniref:LacI family DNA-binding transcriptional regulator n=1 Tax=Sphingobacterium faecale TaxID=2803775 RepID=A0ABS1R6I1_9SPHI|nr:LacI family DNA-binding transcriptional regulator [Sphingobacterium faecale]MBL1410174.1 LacI family DNA-binding transcriptional regulator [Sphingobacterium faecale]